MSELTPLEILATIGVIIVGYIAYRVTQAVAYFDRLLRQQRTQSDLNASDAEVQKIVESYRREALHRAALIEELEAQARYRRLADSYVQDQFVDPERECDGMPWNEENERDHAMRLADLRDEKRRLEIAAERAAQGYEVPERPLQLLTDENGLRPSELLKAYPLPLTPRRLSAHKRAEETIEKGRQMRMSKTGKD